MQIAEISTLLFTPRGAIKRLPFVLGILSINLLVITSMLLLALTLLFIAYTFGANHLFFQVTNNQASLSVAISVLVFSLLITTVYIALYGALLWSHLCLILKRLRDLKLSVWYAVFPYVCTWVSGSIHVSQILSPGMNLNWGITKIVAVLAGLFFVAILMLCPTQK